MTTITTTIDRALLEQALEALELVTECYDSSAVGLEIDAIQALRAELAKPAQKVNQNWNRSIRDSVDALLAKAGYEPDSSARHQLAMMNFDQKAQTTPAWHDAPTCDGLWLCNEGDDNPYRWTTHRVKFPLSPLLVGEDERWYGPIPQDMEGEKS